MLQVSILAFDGFKSHSCKILDTPVDHSPFYRLFCRVRIFDDIGQRVVLIHYKLT